MSQFVTAIAVDDETHTTQINAMLQQDGQLLQVDGMCEDGDVYLATANRHPLTYITGMTR